MKREIIVQWEYRPSKYHMSDFHMTVVSSDNPRYVKGQHFDFGKLEIECKAGYKITCLPL